MRLAEPAWLILLPLAPLPLIWDRFRPRLPWPTLAGFRKAPRTLYSRLRFLPSLCRALAIVAMVVALARPQSVGGTTRIAARGVAIVAALDHSGSMRLPYATAGAPATDRLDAAKRTFARFVQGRPDDLIGLVAFANYADLDAAPTLDHRRLLDAVAALRPAPPGEDGTNLGEAIARGLAGLYRLSPRKKALILLTDGQNRPAVPDPLDPRDMARLARDLGVTLHAIAVGRPGLLDRPTDEATGLPMPSEDTGPNLELLQALADLGGGKLFVADDAGSLERVFDEIDALETSPLTGTVRTRYREEFGPWAVSALALLLLERALSVGRLRRLP